MARRIPTSLRPAGPIAARIAAAILGGYAFTWGFASLVIAALMAAGLGFGDAGEAAALLAFLVFLAVFCWSFASASVVRVWAVLTGGGAIMTGLAWLLATRAAG